MKNWKRFFSILLVLSLLVFAGCGKEESFDEAVGMDDAYESYDDEYNEYDDESGDNPNTVYDERYADEYTVIDGWWVRPEGYEPDGISMIDCFFLETPKGSYTVYNSYGDEVETLDCYLEADILTMDLGFDLVDFIYDDGHLLDPDSGEVEFVAVFDPEFEIVAVRDGEQKLDGSWYRLGDPDGGQIYEISGNQYQKLEDGYVVSEGSFITSDVHVTYSDYSPGTVMTLDLDDDQADLIPADDGSMLIEDTGLDLYIYVSEDTINSKLNTVDGYAAMERLLNEFLCADTYSNGGYFLYFYPTCFQIMDYTLDSEGYMTPESTYYSGTWFIQDDQVYLNYDDKTSDYFYLSDLENGVHIGCVDDYFNFF